MEEAAGRPLKKRLIIISIYSEIAFKTIMRYNFRWIFFYNRRLIIEWPTRY